MAKKDAEQGVAVSRRSPPAVPRHADRGGGLAPSDRASLRPPRTSTASRCCRPTTCAALPGRSTRALSGGSSPPMSPDARMRAASAGWTKLAAALEAVDAGRAPRHLSLDCPRGPGQGQGRAGAVCRRRRRASGRREERGQRRARLYEAAALVVGNGIEAATGALRGDGQGRARRGGCRASSRPPGAVAAEVARPAPSAEAPARSRPRTWPQPSKPSRRPAEHGARRRADRSGEQMTMSHVAPATTAPADKAVARVRRCGGPKAGRTRWPTPTSASNRRHSRPADEPAGRAAPPLKRDLEPRAPAGGR